MRPLLAGLLVSAALMPARPARAETAAVLTPFTEDPVTTEVGERCLGLVAGWLRERGIEVILPGEAAAQLPPDLRHCRQEQCAIGYMQYIKQADYAVLTAVWGQPRGTGATGVSLTFLTRDGQRYDESWAITESLELSVDAALTQAYSSFLRGPGPWLTVRGTPAGAEVLVDGIRVGELPCHARIKPGEHEILVRHASYRPYKSAISVPGKVDTHRELDVALQQESGAAPAAVALAAAAPGAGSAAPAGEGGEPLRPRGAKQADLKLLDGSAPGKGSTRADGARPSGPSIWNYILGGTLVAASVPLILGPLYTAAKQDVVYDTDQWGRERWYDFGTQSAVLLPLGVASLAGGAFLILAAPISSGSGPSDRAAQPGPGLTANF